MEDLTLILVIGIKQFKPYIKTSKSLMLTLLLLNTTCPVLANSADSDQLASEEANWSGSVLFEAYEFVSTTWIK